MYKELVTMGFSIDNKNTPVAANFNLSVVLRDYQEAAVKALIASRYGILEASTGSGKTVMALAVAARLKQKTLFIVHTKVLLEQTVKEVKDKLGIDAGIIGGGKYDIKDFTVATIQTLKTKPPPVGKFGLILLDECHHTPASTFLSIIRKLSALYMYGLSATPDRPDGLTWALYAAIGPSLHIVSKEELKRNKSVIKPEIIPVPTPYVPSKNFDSFDVANHLNDIAKDGHRNMFIIAYIDKIFREHPTVKPIVLTDRIEHAELLASMLADKNPILYHGKLGDQQQKINLEKIKSSNGAFTIATYSSLGEGFDVPLWDTLFLATPFSSSIRTIQTLGRISRAATGKTVAYVHDFVDVNDSVLLARYERRVQTYKSL